MLKDSQTTVGAETVEALRHVRADACVLGICSVDAEVGITTSHHEEAHVKRAMVAASADVIALATADKLRSASPYIVAPVDQLTHIVSGADAPDDLLDPYRAAGITVTRA